jgi:ribose transport system substrate-binding protein
MFMSRQLPILLLMPAVLVPLTSCTSPQHGPEEKYFLIATNIKVPYWQTAQAGLNRAGAQLQVKNEFVGPDTYDPKAQHDEFQRVLKQKPTGILISAGDPKLMQPDIDSAMAQGVPVITIDSDADSSKRLLFIGTDNYKAGMMGGEVVAKQLNGKGNVVIYTMPEQANLNQRLRGYQDAFKPHPQIKITQIVDIKGDARIAFDTTKEILAKGSGKVDALICLEAIACAEVAEVLNRERVTGKVVVAMDTDQRTLEWIEKGSITATIGQKPFTMSFYGIKMLDDLHHHKFGHLSNTEDSFSPIPSFVDTGATLIDKGNIGRYLKERESATSKP